MKDLGWAQLLENLTVVIRMKGFGKCSNERFDKCSETLGVENKNLRI